MERQSQGKATFPPFAQQLIDRGKIEGRAEGRAEGAARAVLITFRVRGIAVSEAARERIMAERDLARLEQWHERAIVAASLAEVLDQ